MGKAILDLLASKVASLIGGPIGWLAEKIMYYGGQALLDLFNNWFRKKKREAVQEKAKEELEKVVKDPNSTVDQRAKSYEDFINSGN